MVDRRLMYLLARRNQINNYPAIKHARNHTIRSVTFKGAIQGVPPYDDTHFII